MRVFVSHYDSPFAADLVRRLRDAGAQVDQSPPSPHAGLGDDPRWPTWYDAGLPAAAAWCDTFVIALGPSWDASTWMAAEAEAGFLRARAAPAFRYCSWDPEGVLLHSPPPGLRRYLERAVPLPKDAGEAAAALLGGGLPPPAAGKDSPFREAMMHAPRTHVIMLYPEAGGAEALAELPEEGVESAARRHHEWWRGVSYYHRDGLRYVIGSAVPEQPPGWLSRVLPTLLYNPGVRVRYRFRQGVPYDLAQLRDALAAAIRADDDILTQFHESGELLEALARATTFDDVAGVLHLAATDTDTGWDDDPAPDA
ncbi:MAG TPA: hypothetical protein VGC13_29950 [Longimicrobium sp.]|jgi:hypothetical protein|uniref:hypothetical protein n=1 Tax=Longimicrobium sp. TaxID=2029185 RepID=UPI002EDA2EA4